MGDNIYRYPRKQYDSVYLDYNVELPKSGSARKGLFFNKGFREDSKFKENVNSSFNDNDEHDKTKIQSKVYSERSFSPNKRTNSISSSSYGFFDKGGSFEKVTQYPDGIMLDIRLLGRPYS